jgi:hypothetical protein
MVVAPPEAGVHHVALAALREQDRDEAEMPWITPTG